MKAGLAELIVDFHLVVYQAVGLLERAGVPRPPSAAAWAGLNIPPTGELGGGAKYLKHGSGCAIQFATGRVDFDFGEHGEIDRFSFAQLRAFAGASSTNYGFASDEELKEAFDQAVGEGTVCPVDNAGQFVTPLLRLEGTPDQATREALISRLVCDFDEIANYIIEKNNELYGRLK